MDDLPLEGIHWLKFERLTALLDLFSASLGELDEVLSLFSPESIDIKHEPASLSGRGLDREAGQLLKRIKDLTISSNQVTQIPTFDNEIWSVVLDSDLNIAIEVCNIEESLQVISRNIALFFQLGN
jgi:hypothetical protein